MTNKYNIPYTQKDVLKEGDLVMCLEKEGIISVNDSGLHFGRLLKLEENEFTYANLKTGLSIVTSYVVGDMASRIFLRKNREGKLEIVAADERVIRDFEKGES